MLTRIEISGFKSFEDMKIDVSPFMVVLGANGVGKSNLFDAMQLLSLCATSNDLKSAFAQNRGDAEELFRRSSDSSPSGPMRIAAELLLPLTTEDPYKDTVEVPHTRVRYELEIALHGSQDGALQRLVVVKESAVPILAKDDRWAPFGSKPSKQFREAHCKYSRSVPYISMEQENGRVQFVIHQDGHGGRKREMPAVAAEATALSSVTTAGFPTMYALKEELRSWRFLQLDPMGLRKPSQSTDPETLLPDGRNLARVLARIRSETTTAARPHGVLNDISADLVQFVPGISKLEVRNDPNPKEYRVEMTYSNQGANEPFNARVLSDGTLRLLALFTLLHDPRLRGMICFEEPENGIHPQRLGILIGRLRELVSDPQATDPDAKEPLLQVLLNSHSPVVLSQLRAGKQRDGEVYWADLITKVGSSLPKPIRCTRLRAVHTTRQTRLDDSDDGAETVSDGEVRNYLETVSGSH